MSAAETPQQDSGPSARSSTPKTVGGARLNLDLESILLNTSRTVVASLIACAPCGAEPRQMLDIAQKQAQKLTHPSSDDITRMLDDIRAHLLAGRLEEATEQILKAEEISIAVPALLAVLACFWRAQGNAERALGLIEHALRNELLGNSWRIILGWERWMMRANARLEHFKSSANKTQARALAHKILRRDQDCAAARETVVQVGAAGTLNELRQAGTISSAKLPHPMSVVQTAKGAIYFGSYTLAGTQASLFRLEPQDSMPRQLSAGWLYSGLVMDPSGDGLVGLCGGENEDMKVRALHRLALSGEILEVQDLSGIDDLASGIPYGLGRTDNGTLVFLDLLRGRLYAASANDLFPRMLCDVSLHGRPLYYGVIENQAYVTFANHSQLLIVDVDSSHTEIVRRAHLKDICSINKAPGTSGFFMVKRAYVKPGNTALMYDILIHTDREYNILGTKRLGCIRSCGVMPFNLAGKDCLCSLSYDLGAIVYRLNS